MKAAHKFFIVISVMLLSLSGCSDPGAVFDQNNEIENHNWSYTNKIRYAVNINDATAQYNLYFNLRVGAEYKYANLFVLLHRSGPDVKPTITRYEVKLANPDGEWLGTGSGNLYSYQVPFRTLYKFPSKGVYRFEIEQNMRDNPLQGVSDVGLRVEKVK